jgi:hypothetical protein
MTGDRELEIAAAGEDSPKSGLERRAYRSPYRRTCPRRFRNARLIRPAISVIGYNVNVAVMNA